MRGRSISNIKRDELRSFINRSDLPVNLFTELFQGQGRFIMSKRVFLRVILICDRGEASVSKPITKYDDKSIQR